jgi:hypothetical protein
MQPADIVVNLIESPATTLIVDHNGRLIGKPPPLSQLETEVDVFVTVPVFIIKTSNGIERFCVPAGRRLSYRYSNGTFAWKI